MILGTATIALGISIPMVSIALLVMAAGVGAVIRPEIGLHLLVLNAMVGLTHVAELPRVGPLSAPILIEALVAAAILFQVALMGRRLPVGTRLHAVMGLLAAWILLSILTGISVGPENFQQYRSLFLVRLVIFVMITVLVTDLKQIRRLVVTLLVSNVGLLGVATAVRLGRLSGGEASAAEPIERTGALVQNPNELAFNLTTMLVLCIVSFLLARRAWTKGLLLLLAGADLAFILSTLSRSGFISMCLVLLFLIFKLTGNLRAVTLTVVLVLCGWLAIPQELFARFSEIDEIQDVDRVRVARVGLAMALDYPLLGVGLGNYVAEFPRYNVSNMRRPAPSHNMYLDLAAQMGLPALALYLSAIAIVWRGLRRTERELRGRGLTRSAPYLLGLGCQAFLVNLAVFGLSGDVEFDYSAFVILGIATSLTAAGSWRLRGRPLGEAAFGGSTS